MNESIDLEYIKNLAAGFVVDDLTPEETEEFRQLLAENPHAIAEVEDLQEVLRQVLDGFIDVEVPTHLLPQIIAQAEDSVPETTRNHHLQPPHQPKLKRLPRPGMRFAAGIAAIFTIFLGIDNYRLRQNLGIITAENLQLRRDANQALVVKNLLQNSQTRLFTLEAVNSSNIGAGRMIINPEQKKAVMVFQNLPAPPPGNVYMLWTVVASRKLPCGKVKPYSWGNASYELTFTNQMYQEFYHPEFSGLVVTLEKNPNVSHPSGTVVMQSSI